MGIRRLFSYLKRHLKRVDLEQYKNLTCGIDGHHFLHTLKPILKKTIFKENSMVPIQRKFKKNILIKFLILLLIIILDTSSMTYKYVILTDITIDTQFLTISQIIFVGILSKYIIKHPFKN